MKEERSFIVAGIAAFREKHRLAWEDLTVGVAGDLLQALTDHKVLYATPLPDYALFLPRNRAEADSVVSEFAARGCRTACDRMADLPGVLLWVYVFSLKVPVEGGPYPPFSLTTPFKEWHKLDSASLPGEMTPFVFKGERYHLENVLAHFLTPGLAVGERPAENHFRVRRESDDRLISIPLLNCYFVSAFVWRDRCYCFGRWQEGGGFRLAETVSEDLISWSPPRTILDLSAERTGICNSAVTFDGKRFVLLYECADPAYPIFTFKFLESEDLLNWRPIPEALCVWNKYAGGPAMYFFAPFYYVTYVDLFIHPVTRKLCFRTSITRSKDLIDWEEAPEERPVLLPDFSSRPDPEGHPAVWDVNASDAEFIQEEGQVRAYYNSGNQWGVSDNRTAVCSGTMRELFEGFFV